MFFCPAGADDAVNVIAFRMNDKNHYGIFSLADEDKPVLVNTMNGIVESTSVAVKKSGAGVKKVNIVFLYGVKTFVRITNKCDIVNFPAKIIHAHL